MDGFGSALMAETSVTIAIVYQKGWFYMFLASIFRYILKKDRKKMEEQNKESEISLEELIEKEASLSLFPIFIILESGSFF